MVQEDLFVGPQRNAAEFAAANLQAESYLEQEHNVRWTAHGVAHAASEHYSQCIDITTFARQHSRARPAQSLPHSGSPLARRMHRNTRNTLPQYYEMKLLSDPPPKRSAQDILFDYLDTEERGNYNDLARRIQKRFEELEGEKSKRRDRSNVKPLTNLT